MEAKRKQQLVGALVLLAVAAIFLPLLFHNPHPSANLSMVTTVPKAPDKPVVQLQLPATPSTVKPSIESAEPSHSDVSGTSRGTKENHEMTKEGRRMTKPVPPLLSKTPTAWVVQVASFADPINAKHLLKQLRAKGFDAYTRQSKGKRTITQVFVGPEIDHDKINQIQKELKQQLQLNGVVKRYQL